MKNLSVDNIEFRSKFIEGDVHWQKIKDGRIVKLTKDCEKQR